MISELLSPEAIKEVMSGEFPGYHDRRHWLNVSRTGASIAIAEGISPNVPLLFGIYHDCRRVNDGDDPDHGIRASDLVREHHIKGWLNLSEDEVWNLRMACKWHSDGQTSEIPVIGVCWDADRLDLPRVGWQTDEKFMSTETGKHLARLQKGIYNGL